MSHTAADIADLTIYDPDGTPTPVSRLWSDGTSLIAFVRHFG